MTDKAQRLFRDFGGDLFGTYMEKISKIESDVQCLRGEYERITLWGSSPDGDVKFEDLMEWFARNDDTVDYMIKTVKLLNDIRRK